MGKVVYLTGVPASGKSTVATQLERELPQTLVFRFGTELTKLIQERTIIDQEGLRTRSAHLVLPEDVSEIDERAVTFAHLYRQTHNVIIDTHALTNEAFGFRMTPLSSGRIADLSPDFLVTLIVEPEEIQRRISADPKGRPQLSIYQLWQQSELQNFIPATYSIICGVPAYFLWNNNEEQLSAAINELHKLM